MKYLILAAVAVVLFPVEGNCEWEVYVNSNRVTTVWADTTNVYWGSGHGAVIHNPSSGRDSKILKSVGGLVGNRITALVRDGEGRLWLGTADRGLSVLSPDGTWRTHSTGTLDLLSNDVRDVATGVDENSEEPLSRTVVGTSEGVTLFENGEFRNFYDATDWAGSGCNSAGAVAVGAGRMVVGTDCGCFSYLFSSRTWETILPQQPTVGIGCDGGTVFWIVTEDSIYTYDGGPPALVSKQSLEDDVIHDIAAHGSTVWVAGSNGPARYDYSSESWTHVTGGLTGDLLDAGSVHVTDRDVPWIGTDAGVAVLNGEEWVMHASDGPPGNWVQDIEIDRDGRVWCATGTRGSPAQDANIGLMTYDGFEWDQIIKDPLVGNAAYCLDADPVDGSLFVGFWGDGLMRYDLNSAAWYTLNADLESNVISDVYVDPAGRLYFGEYLVGLGLRCPDGTVIHYSDGDQPPCIETECITAIGPGPSAAMIGSYLSPSENCLDRVVALDVGADCSGKSDDVCRIWTSLQGYVGGNAYVFATDIYGVTWMGTSGGLSSYDGRWHGVNTALGDVWDIAVDSYGTKWVATGEGLYVLEGYGTVWADFSGSVKIYDSSNSPLDDSPVKALAFDADGALWIGTAGGGVFKFSQPRERPRKSWVDVFPNPYYSWEDIGGKGIRFTGFMPGRKIRIYTVAGDLVAEIDGGAAWHLTNRDGAQVVPGVYIYHAYAQDGGEFMGRIVIVR